MSTEPQLDAATRGGGADYPDRRENASASSSMPRVAVRPCGVPNSTRIADAALRLARHFSMF
jgi:hypothetical protein